MEPKEKAEALIERFKPCCKLSCMGPGWDCQDDESARAAAKQCALVVADELIEESHGMFQGSRYDYWKEVKKELEQ